MSLIVTHWCHFLWRINVISCDALMSFIVTHWWHFLWRIWRHCEWVTRWWHFLWHWCHLLWQIDATSFGELMSLPLVNWCHFVWHIEAIFSDTVTSLSLTRWLYVIWLIDVTLWQIDVTLCDARCDASMPLLWRITVTCICQTLNNPLYFPYPVHDALTFLTFCGITLASCFLTYV